jgi:hypothetical protein
MEQLPNHALRAANIGISGIAARFALPEQAGSLPMATRSGGE